MSEILGGIAALIIVIGVYAYYGRKIYNFILKLLFIKRTRKFLHFQKSTESWGEKEWKDYGTWMKKRIEKDEEDKRKGIFKA